MEERSFLNDLAAPTPTPGGGAVACYTAAMAAALGEMVSGLAAKKGDIDPTLLERLGGFRRQLLAKADEDAQSFEAVMAEVRRPKDDPGRKDAIGRALAGAAQVPLEAMAMMAELAKVLLDVRSVCPKSALSDWEAALLLVRAGREIARKNVVVNLGGAEGKDGILSALAASDVAFAQVLGTV